MKTGCQVEFLSQKLNEDDQSTNQGKCGWIILKKLIKRRNDGGVEQNDKKQKYL